MQVEKLQKECETLKQNADKQREMGVREQREETNQVSNEKKALEKQLESMREKQREIIRTNSNIRIFIHNTAPNEMFFGRKVADYLAKYVEFIPGIPPGKVKNFAEELNKDTTVDMALTKWLETFKSDKEKEYVNRILRALPTRASNDYARSGAMADGAAFSRIYGNDSFFLRCAQRPVRAPSRGRTRSRPVRGALYRRHTPGPPRPGGARAYAPSAAPAGPK